MKNKAKISESHHLMLLSPSDIGVRRNNGRNGTRFGPKAITNTFKKLNFHSDILFEEIDILTVSDQTEEQSNFEQAQILSSKNISSQLTQSNQKVLHIGGGHDHVFPLLSAIEQTNHFDNILVLNIDAHCDTRVADIHNSGTPFRNFSEFTKKPFHIIQYGIQHYANSDETMTPLPNGSSEFLFFEELKKKTLNFTNIPEDLFVSCPFEITEKTAFVLSLDADAIHGSEMPGVSAVNGMGIPSLHVHDLISLTKERFSRSFFGIYEFNPVYDSINQLGARVISSFIYQYLRK